ncbi:YqeB family protein [Dactylosporangium sp. CA-233914]|uniref:YqeB family protein n=1 Tax=Dactylosporangium sp. CA-233914 TaxID=3239934 RepID=UPI003D8F8FD7
MTDHELGFSRGDRLVMLGGFPLAGGLAGWFLPVVARWLISLDWVPFAGPLRLVAHLDSGWGRAGVLAAGLVAGGLLGAGAVHESLRVTVGDELLTVVRGEARRTVARSSVDAVFMDGRLLVVLDRESRQVIRDSLENHDSPDVARAFLAHGYPWVDHDPYRELYRRWVPDLPDLPAAVNAVLAARGKALEAGSAADAEELRDEVQKLGYTVRDVGKVQHWRPLVKP